MPPQQIHFRMARGHTWHPAGYEATTVPESLYGDSGNFEGQVTTDANINPSTKALRDNTNCVLMLLRNSTSGTLTGGNAGTFASGYKYKRAGAKVTQIPDATHTGEVDFIVDDHYTGTIPIGHLFWAIVKGQVNASIYTASAVAIGDHLVASASSGALMPCDKTGSAAALANNILAGAKIRALEVKTATGGAAAAATKLVEVNLYDYAA